MGGEALAGMLFNRFFPSPESKLNAAVQALDIYRTMYPDQPITDQAFLGKMNEAMSKVAGFELPKMGVEPLPEQTRAGVNPPGLYNMNSGINAPTQAATITPQPVTAENFRMRPGEDSPYVEALRKEGRVPRKEDFKPILPTKSGMALIGEDGTVKTVDVPRGYTGHIVPTKTKSLFQHIVEGVDESGNAVYGGINQEGQMVPLPGNVRPIVKREKPEPEYEDVTDEKGNVQYQREKNTKRLYPVKPVGVNADRDRNGRTLELILNKMANNEELTPGEQQVLTILKPDDQKILNATFSILEKDPDFVEEKDPAKRKARALATFNELDDIAKQARGKNNTGVGTKTKEVIRTGTDPKTGRKVNQYKDGTVGYAE